jgi:hypothetical protein
MEILLEQPPGRGDFLQKGLWNPGQLTLSAL